MVCFFMIPVGSNIHMCTFIYVYTPIVLETIRIPQFWTHQTFACLLTIDRPQPLSAGFLDQQLLLCLRLNGLGDNVETWRSEREPLAFGTTGGSITGTESLVFPGFPYKFMGISLGKYLTISMEVS